MSRKGSVVYQIQKTVFQNTVPEMSEKHRKANDIPKGRHEAKQQNIDTNKYIFSYADAKRVMQTINRVCCYNNIDNIRDLKGEHSNKYIQNLIQKGRSAAYIRTEKYAIQKFDNCMLNTGKRSKHDSSIVATIKTPKDTGRTRGGRYTSSEAKKILNQIKDNESAEKYTIAKIQNEAGLRISEAINLKARNIIVKKQKIVIFPADNISKGGRPREVTLDEKIKVFLEKIKKNNTGRERVFKTSKRTMQDTVQNACEVLGITCRGTHGLRGAFAYQRLKQALKRQKINSTDSRIQKIVDKHGNALLKKEKDALKEVTTVLGHNRIRIVRERYLTR